MEKETDSKLKAAREARGYKKEFKIVRKSDGEFIRGLDTLEEVEVYLADRDNCELLKKKDK